MVELTIGIRIIRVSRIVLVNVRVGIQMGGLDANASIDGGGAWGSGSSGSGGPNATSNYAVADGNW